MVKKLNVNREIKIDFIRGIAMLIIVLYHYSCVFELEGTIGPWRPFWHFASGTWGSAFVVVFFVISGYVMNMCYGEEKLDVITYWKKRWIKIFPTFYVAWGGMYIVRTLQNQNPLWGGNPLLLIESVLGVDGYFKNHKNNYYSVGDWFLGAIIIIYVVYPIVLNIYIKYKKQVLIIYVTVIIMFEITGVVNYISRSNMFFCIFSFFVGMLFYDYNYKIRNICVCVCSLIITTIFVIINLQTFLSEQLIVQIVGISLFLFLYSIPIEKVMKISIIKKIVMLLSSLSYPVMITHHVLVYWGVHAFEKIGLNLNLGLVIIMIGIYGLSYLLDCVVQKMVNRVKNILEKRNIKKNEKMSQI